MPTILRWNGYRFYFFSNEGHEPPHVHIDKAGRSCKFWLTPVRLSQNRGYADHEMKEIHAKVAECEQEFVDAWNGYFGH
jgi:Domain of unknown function (DUF4160)